MNHHDHRGQLSLARNHNKKNIMFAMETSKLGYLAPAYKGMAHNSGFIKFK